MKKFFSVCFFLFLIGYAVFFLLPFYQDGKELDALYNGTYFVAFAEEEIGRESELVDVEEFSDYRSDFSAYGTRTCYSFLNREEKILYRLLEYAMDHSYTQIFVDQRLMQEMERAPLEVACVLSMDSPFVEQNLSVGKTSFTVPLSGSRGRDEREVSGTIIQIKQFKTLKIAKKMEALNKAQEIVAAMPQGLDDMEKARYFYRYLTKNVKYSLYEEGAERNFLYDALCVGVTQCDGFANAFSLLCNLSGIDCYEKLYDPDEGSGHTWNTFYIDGIWYNADCALSDSAAEHQEEMDFESRFAFSDALQNNTPMFAEKLTPCIVDRTPVSAKITNEDAAAIGQMVKKAFDTRKSRFVLISYAGEEIQKEELQAIANTLQNSIRSLGYSWNGVNYYFIFKT